MRDGGPLKKFFTDSVLPLSVTITANISVRVAGNSFTLLLFPVLSVTSSNLICVPFHFVFVCANSSTANNPQCVGPAVYVLIFTCCLVFQCYLNCG